MTELDEAHQEYLALRDSAPGVLLATLGGNGSPEASYAPCVWYNGDCYLYLSELSAHTGNLKRDPQVGLMLIEDAADTPNPFTRKRASLQGRAGVVERADDLFGQVLAAFRQRFGKVMEIIEPLPDFFLFRICISAGSFVRGFGQAYELAGERLDRLAHIDPSSQARGQQGRPGD